jgi:ferredoxin
VAVRYRLRVDPIRCTGHGLCADLFPEGIRLDDWGYPILDPEVVPADLLPLARRAVTACPDLALSIERERQRHPSRRAPTAR